MNGKHRLLKIVSSSVGPILSIVSFILTYYLDPLNFGKQQPLASIPAFLISVVILLIAQNIEMSREIRNANKYSDRIYEAVKDYLHVTTLGSPESAMEYVIKRLPVLREVKNTSFNLHDEHERADEKFYETETYSSAMGQIALYSTRKTIWKDVGDSLSVNRFRLINENASRIAKGRKFNYKYKLMSGNEPQLNFIILEYQDGKKEVLFNWDFRGIGQDPIVLISREYKIIEMFSIHYAHLWKRGSIDHDRIDTKSNATK
jgi:hypothetical protein